jgi:benzoylformate decarboxylase
VTRNGAEVFTGVLAGAGVDTIFGLPGSTEASLLEALRAGEDLRYVLGLHEGAVVSMADGYARVTGRPGVVGLHTTVGTLNGASQIYNAYRDYSPVVVTAGHKDRRVLSEDGFCAHPHLPDVVRPFTRWAHQTLSAAELGSDLWRALHVAMTPPVGPTYLAVPEDFLRGPVPDDAPEPPLANRALWAGWAHAAGHAGGGSVPEPAVCAAIAAGMAAARWPVIVAGSAARECVPELRALADQLACPLVGTDFTDLADLPFPTADPRFFGLYGEDPAVLDGCDLVVAVGARVFFPFSAARHPRLPEGARLVHIHPDPAQVGREAPTEAGIVASPAAALRALAPHLDGAVDPAMADARTGRLATVRAAREQARQAEREAEGTPLPVPVVAAELSQVLPPEAIVVDEGVRSSTRLLRHLELGDGQAMLRSSGGALGWGVPAAVGASLGRPDRPVIAVVGDGSYHFSVQAIWTAVREQASLVVLVLDNGGYLAVKRAIEGYLGVPRDPREHPGTRLPAIDHALVATGYGAAGAMATERGQVAAAVKQALAGGGVHVIGVPVAEVRP